MAARNRGLEISCEMALVAVVAVACIAGIPPIVDTLAQSLAQTRTGTALVGAGCRNCGVVEGVREVTLGNLKHTVSTVSGEGFAMVFGLLSGKLDTGPVKIYEVAVRLQDGSTRVLREASLPSWKMGDRVKVVMGQIRPVS